MANQGILFEMVCIALERESSGCKNVLVVNATDEFNRNGWILTSENKTEHVQEYSPMSASRLIPHDYIVCNELPSLESVFAVLCNSANHGVKRAMVIGEYDFDSHAQIQKHWAISQCPFGKNVFMLSKITKRVHNQTLEVGKDMRSLVHMINRMGKRKR